MSQYHCTRCGRAIFDAASVLERVKLWDLGEYSSDTFVIRKALREEELRRYDVSLHEGWYCCRFIMMRMTVDKFGTGRNRLVYADSVVEVPPGETVAFGPKDKGQIKLSATDFDSVTATPSSALSVVKFGAIWCPPCRLVDQAILALSNQGGVEGVDFFEVDVDEEPELGRRFASRSIPTLHFYYGGQRLLLTGSSGNLLNGAWVGGIGAASLRALCSGILLQALAGAVRIDPFTSHG